MGLLTPDTSYYSEYSDKGKFVLAWRLTLLFAFIFCLLTIAFVFINTVASLFYLSIFLCAAFGLIYLAKTRNYKSAFWVFTICASVINTISFLTITEIIHYAEFFWIICIVIFAFVGLGRNVGVAFIIFHAVAVSVHMLFFLNENVAQYHIHTLSERIGTIVELMMALCGTAYLLHEYLKFHAYSEQQLKLANEGLERTNQLVIKKNEENSILAKEIHHRVKNNLQIVISLLRMQSDEVKSSETKKHFSEAINRIMTMSLIHEKLYQEKELSLIQIDDYLRDLARAVTSSGSVRQEAVELKIETKIATVGLKTIVPLGLLINELLTNSMKHAFQQAGNGDISVSIHENESGRIILNYSDSGNWKRREEEDTGFGLELIEVLTEQLDGEFNRTGSTYSFELSNLDH